MMDAGLILYHDDASPGAIKAHKAMALKDIAWNSLVLHDADLADTFQAFGSHPVLQIGADVYVGAERIIEELERTKPEPTFFPNGNRGMPIALAFWAEHFFEAANKHLSEGDPAAAVTLATAHASLIDRQMSDGRQFLQGPTAGLADIHGYSALAGLERVGFKLDDLFTTCPHLEPWMARLAALGEGRRREVGEWGPQATETALIGDESQSKGFRPHGSGSYWISGVCLEHSADELIIAINHSRLGRVRAHYAPAFVEFRGK